MLREKVSPVRIPVYHFAMAASGSHSVTIALGDDCVPPLTQVEELSVAHGGVSLSTG